MAGIRALRAIQIGKETTAGTKVAATTIWRGTGVLDDQREVTFPEEEIGIVSGTDRSYIAKLAAGIEFPDTPATFEQLPYLLEAGIKKVGTGAADGVGTGLIYAYPFPTTAVNTIQTYSIEGGDDQQFEVMEYGAVSQLKITGKAGEALMMGGTWFGRQVTDQAKTGALSVPTVEEILFGTGRLYIDDADGTAGTTQLSNTLVGMELTIDTGWHPVYTSDNLYFSLHQFDYGSFGVELKITFLHDGSARAEKTNWRNQAPRLLQLAFEGSAVETGGTEYQKNTLLIDLAGKWESFDTLDEQDGDDVITGTFRGRYNATAATAGQILVVNELASLT